MRQLQGRNVLLTGASRGVGPYIARAFAEKGANLALVARSAPPLQQLASELTQAGVRSVAISADLSDLDSHGMVLHEAGERLGPIDVLINNAAIEASSEFADLAPARIQELLRLDLIAPMLLTRALLPQLLARRSGHIVNIASLSGKSGTPYNSTYAAAKGGLIVFSQSLRAELRGSGVSVSSVSPGFISEAGMFADRARETNRRAPVAVGESTPEQVANAILRAVVEDRAEILVSPGPARLLQAINQLAPDLINYLMERLGVTALFREAAHAERDAMATSALQEAQRSGFHIDA